MEQVMYEASPDVQVMLKLTRNRIVVDELEANINISKTTSQLKASLAKPLQIAAENLEIWKGNVQLQDDSTLMEYEIAADDILEVKDTTPENS